MGGEGSGDVLKLSVGEGSLGVPLIWDTWNLRKRHGKVVPLGAGRGKSVVCHYVHIVLRSDSLSVVAIQWW